MSGWLTKVKGKPAVTIIDVRILSVSSRLGFAPFHSHSPFRPDLDCMTVSVVRKTSEDGLTCFWNPFSMVLPPLD